MALESMYYSAEWEPVTASGVSGTRRDAEAYSHSVHFQGNIWGQEHSEAFRLEYFYDPKGVAFLSDARREVVSATLTHASDLASNFRLMVEGRYDRSPKNTFLNKVGTTLGRTQQGTFTLAGIYQF